MKPRLAESGDQNGPDAPSVPASGWKASDERSRIQIRVPETSVATTAMRVPSGDNAKCDSANRPGRSVPYPVVSCPIASCNFRSARYV